MTPSSSTPSAHPAATPGVERPLDPRIARSRRAVGNALMELLADGRPYTDLTVSEIAACAGLTRKTFYAHFGSIDAVVRDLAMDLFTSTLLAVGDDAFILPLAESGLGDALFGQLHEHLDVLEPLATLCPTALFLEPAREAVQTILFGRILAINDLGPISDFDRDYLAHLASSTLHGAITAWASRGFKDSPEEVAAFALELMAPVSDRIFEAASQAARHHRAGIESQS